MHPDWRLFLQNQSLVAFEDIYKNAQLMLMSLDHYGVIEVSGKDAKSFLQGQLTLNMNLIQPAQGGYGGYCNLKGRLHALFYLVQTDEAYRLILPKSNITHLLETLKKYALFSKVVLNDKTDALAIAGALNARALPILLEKGNYQVSQQSNLTFIAIPEDRGLLLGSAADMEAFWQSMRCPKTTGTLWDYADIQAGIPMLTKETLEVFLPHYLNLKELGALNFEKGCYLGQEIIARMEFKATIKQHLIKGTLQDSTPLIPGVELFNPGSDNPIGQIVNAVQTPKGIELLLTVKDEALEQAVLLNNQKEIMIHPIN